MEILEDEFVSGNWTPPMLEITPAKKKRKTKAKEQNKSQQTTKANNQKKARAKKQNKNKQSKKTEREWYV